MIDMRRLDSARANLRILPPVLPRESPRIRALVRGTGSIGARHVRVLQALGVFDVLAWPVRAGRVLADRSDAFGGVQQVDGYPDEGVDLVVIATDTARHVDDTLEALAHTPAAILLEKPVSAGAQEAVPLATHSGALSIFTSAPLRFHQALAVTREVLPQLGMLTSAQVRSQSWLPSWRPGRDYKESYSSRADEGGVLRDLVHDLDYPLLMLDSPSELIAKLGHGILGIEAEESADLLWGDAATVSVRLDYTSRVKTRGIRLAVESGAIAWDVVRNSVTIETPQGLTEELVFPDDADVDGILARQTLAIMERTGIISGRSMSRFSPSSLEEGIRAVAIGDAARRSHASGGPATVAM